MTKLKFLVSLLLALGLVACNGDEDEADDAKYSLKVAKPSGAKVGTAFPVEVKLYKGDALVKGDDAKGAKDADVSGSIKCKEHTAKVDLTKVKLGDAGKASFSVTIEHNSDRDGDEIGEKGYTECVVSASTEFGDDKTKASGDSAKFDVAAKTDSGNGGAVKTPTIPSITSGVEFSITDGEDKKINLVAANDTDGSAACSDRLLFKITKTGTPAVPSAVVQVVAAGHTIEEDDIFVVAGNTTCKIWVKDAVASKNVTNSSDRPTIGDFVTTNGLGFEINNPDGITGTKHGFVRNHDDAWEKITSPFPTGAGDVGWVQAGITATTTTGETLHALFAVDNKWTYGSDDV